jgi:hypothetical protein
MIVDLLIFGAVDKHLLFTGFPFAADHFFAILLPENTFHPEAIRTLLNSMLLPGTEIAFRIAQIIYGIKQIGLTAAIGAGYAGNGGAELE